MKTYIQNVQNYEKKWLLIDAEGKVLGRLATEVASILRGKNKPEYSPHLDLGDNVIIINAEKVKVTGNKYNGKIYRKHTGFIGGLKEIVFKDLIKKKPTYIIQHAVKGMLPNNKLNREIINHLKIYTGPEHPHKAQKPIKVEIK